MNFRCLTDAQRKLVYCPLAAEKSLAAAMADCDLVATVAADKGTVESAQSFTLRTNLCESRLYLHARLRQQPMVCSDPIAYCISTSGTTSLTGTRVQVPLASFTTNLVSIFERLTSCDQQLLDWDLVCISVSPATFDPSLIETMLPLICNGGRLVLVPGRLVRSPALLYETICSCNVTVLMCTPSLFMRWDPRHRQQLLQRLRHVILGGEVFPVQLLAQYQQLMASGSDEKSFCQLWNIYGTTECSVWASMHRFTDASIKRCLEIGMAPIGQPLAGADIELRDREKNNEILDGHTDAEGVLWLGGAKRVCYINDETEPAV